MGYIYKIKNKTSNLYYIGSTINLKERLLRHKAALKKNSHHNIYLQRAWNKYGEESFEFEMIMNCKLEEMIDWEQAFCDVHKEMYGVYNMSEFVDNPTRGSKRSFSKETRLKMSEAHKGMATGRIGQIHSPETKEKISQSSKGRKLTEEHRKKISDKRKILLQTRSDLGFQKGSRINIGRTNLKFQESVKLIDPNGNIVERHGIVNFCKEFNLDQGNISKLLKGKLNSVKGWRN